MRILIAMLLFCGSTMQTQDKMVFLSYFSDQSVEPTADADSAFWKGIKGVTIEKSVLGPAMPEFRAEVRSRWTKEYVYFLFIGPYQKLTLNPKPDTQRETYRMWEKDCFEVYLGADFQHTNRYREFQMSPAGEFLDLDIDSTKDKPGFNGEQNWNSGMKVKARVDEKEKIWYGEMRIPIAAVDTRPADGRQRNAHQSLPPGRRAAEPRLPRLAAADGLESPPPRKIRHPPPRQVGEVPALKSATTRTAGGLIKGP